MNRKPFMPQKLKFVITNWLHLKTFVIRINSCTIHFFWNKQYLSSGYVIVKQRYELIRPHGSRVCCPLANVNAAVAVEKTTNFNFL